MNINYIPRLKYPGSFLSCQDQNSQVNIQRLLIMLENTLQEAAIELFLFDKLQNDFKELKKRHYNVILGLGIEPLEEEILPGYHIKLMIVYARSFLYSLDRIKKLIFVLKGEHGIKSNIETIYEKFIRTFTDLGNVRNSSAHMEDRIRRLAGMGKNKKTIAKNNPIYLESLEGNKFSSLMLNGDIGRIEVSLRSLFLTRDYIQEIIDSFQWQGYPRNASS